jgi:phytoene dehydrogenase-like protein
MPPASIAAAAQRVIQSRRELRGALRRLGARLARPPSLLAAAASGAVVGFSLERLGGAGALARALASAALRHGASLYVHDRTEKARAPGEDACNVPSYAPDAHAGERSQGLRRGKSAR